MLFGIKKLFFVGLLAALVALPLSAVAQDSGLAGETIALPGLDGEVTVHYDAYGIPRIYATTPHDLMMTQGYIHAQDRWWQMEWFRHQGSGRLSELMGPNLVQTDTFLRTLGLNRHAQRDLNALDPDILALLEDYAEGVNAYLEGKTPSELATEYRFIELLSGEMPEVAPWTPLDTASLVQALSIDQEGSDLQNELTYTGVSQAAGVFASLVLWPPFPYDQRPLISEPGFETDLGQAASVPEVAALPSFEMPEIAMPLGIGLADVGSNSWAISGELSGTGSALLANDPHIGIQNPSIWYMNGLHCVEVSEACPYDVFGYSFASSPLVVIGHNRDIAWGWTNSGLDTIDTYALELNPDNPLQYRYNDEWVDMDIIEEVIEVAGGEAVTVPVRETRFGVVVNDLFGLPDPIAARWTVSVNPVRAFQTIRGQNLARHWDDFEAASEQFHIGQNFIYADTEGNIGLFSAGNIPIRPAGQTGLQTQPANAESEWQGFVDTRENPRLYNPEAGYIVAANNPTVRPQDSPALISSFYDVGYRAERIEYRIQNAETLDMDTLASIQTDNFNPAASVLVPYLGELFPDDDWVAWLAAWDYQNDVDSGEAMLFNAFYANVMRLVFDEYYQTGTPPSGDSLQIWHLGQMIQSENHPLWANPAVEDATPAALMRQALDEAVERLTAELGSARDDWAWGALHQGWFRHQPLGNLPAGENIGLDLVLQDIYRTFNRRTPVDGGTASVNNMRWVAGEDDFLLRGAIVSMRQVINLADLDDSRFVMPLGQSGDPFSAHYDDQLALWASGQYVPYAFEAATADGLRARHVTFTPAD